MVLRVKLDNLVVTTGLKTYIKYRIYDHNGEVFIYVVLNKALYKLLRGALNFFNNMWINIKTVGFIRNRYGVCIDNRMVVGRQCTMTWHVDGVKILHMNEEVVSGITVHIKVKYG